MPSTVNTIVFRLLLLLVIAAPLPFGGHRPWAWSLLAAAAGALALVWGLLVVAGRARAPMAIGRLWAVALPFVLVLAWAMAQGTPGLLPAAWTHPLWAEAAAALGRRMEGAVSLDPALTAAAVLRLTTYGAVFWLAVQLGRDRARAREALRWVAVAGVLYAAYGLTVHFAGVEHVLWVAKRAYVGDLTATFINRNAYGAYAGLGVLACAALFVHGLGAPRHLPARRLSHEVAEALLTRALPALVGVLVIGTALLLTHSRGAFAATAVGLAVLLAALAAGRLLVPRAAVAAGGLLLAVAVAAVLVSGEHTVERLLLTGAEAEGRHTLYVLTLAAISDAPWSGFGLGAFAAAFRLYRDGGLLDPVVYDFAHGVHLELAMDLGLPAAGLLYLAFAVVVGVCLRGVRVRRRDQIHPALALAAAALVAAHGVIDFSAQMPGVALTLALLLGIGYAQSWNTAPHGADRKAAEEASPPPWAPAPAGQATERERHGGGG